MKAGKKMKNTVLRRLITTALLCSLCLTGLLTSCNNGNTDDPKDSTGNTVGESDSVTQEVPTEKPDETVTDTATEEPTEKPTEEPTGSPTEKTTEPSANPSEPDKKGILKVEWHLGYVGSSTNKSYKDVLNPAGGQYSYSDIIHIEKAGTVISFTDDNTNSGSDKAFASAAAYVVSSWKKSGELWVLDTDGFNSPGNGNNNTDIGKYDGQKIVYTYTTTKDNEYIRLCFRSGQTASFIPAAYPEVTYDTKDTNGKVETVTEGKSNDDVFDANGKDTIKVKWNFGYVGSTDNTQGYANKICNSGTSYSYTDVFTVPKAGTRITFTDNNQFDGGDGKFASNAAYIISSWKNENGNWAIDLDGANIAGTNSSAGLIATPGVGCVTYSYVTYKDNENLRICYRSGNPTKYPCIFTEYTGEEGTVAKVQKEKEALIKYLEESKKNTNYPVLEGITMNVIGDSYFAGNGLNSMYVWPAILASKYNMKFKNYGVNGSTISNYVTTNNPMVSRLDKMENNNANIIIIEGGKNDYNKNVPIGKNDDTVTTTFKGALRATIGNMKKKYPDALIICATVWNVNSTNSLGLSVTDYGKAMKEIAALMGVPCFDATDTELCGVDMNSPEFRAKYCMTATDVSHLNADGHKLVLPAFEKFIADEYTKFLAK